MHLTMLYEDVYVEEVVIQVNDKIQNEDGSYKITWSLDGFIQMVLDAES